MDSQGASGSGLEGSDPFIARRLGQYKTKETKSKEEKLRASAAPPAPHSPAGVAEGSATKLPAPTPPHQQHNLGGGGGAVVATASTPHSADKKASGGLDLPRSGSTKYRVARNMVPARSWSPPPRKSRPAARSRQGSSACSDPRTAALFWPPKVQLHPGREETPRSVRRHRRRRRSSGRTVGARAGGGSAFRGSGPTQPGRESAL